MPRRAPAGFQHGELFAQQVDHITPDPLPSQLCLDHAPAARCMAVTLLEPPAGENEVVEQPKLGHALERDIDDRAGGLGTLEPALNLPAAARSSPEEPRRK